MPFAKLQNIELYYTQQGAGEPFILLHGLGGSQADWSPQIDNFASHFKLILPDLRGHGQSEKPKLRNAYTIKQLADDIAQLLDYLSLPAVYLLGVSLGGMVALELALNYPDKVNRLILVNAGAQFYMPSLKYRFNAILRYLAIYCFGMRGIANDLSKHLAGDNLTLQTDLKNRLLSNSPQAYLNSLLAIRNFNRSQDFKHLKKKILLIAGTRDYLPVEYYQALCQSGKSCTLSLIESGNHILPWLMPETFNQTVLNFLNEKEN